MQIPPELYGPFGVLTVLAIVGAVLWRAYERSVNARIADLTAQRDLAIEERNVAIAGWRDQTEVTKDLAGVVAADSLAQTAAIQALGELIEKQTRADAAARRKP